MAPEYASAATSLAEAGSPVKLAKVILVMMMMMVVVMMMVMMMCNARLNYVLGRIWI